MKTKKNLKSNLEKKSNLFLEIGITLTLALLLVAFESGQTEIKAETLANIGNSDVDIDMIPITRTKTTMPKPPAAPVDYTIIDDPKLEFEEIDLFFNNEGDPLEGMDFYPMDEDEGEADEPDFFIVVEDMPEYHGGNESMFQQHVQKMVKYPEAAVDMGIQGMVTVAFTIDKTGKLTDPQILRSPDVLLSNAVLEALAKTDKWKPGEQRKRKVPVRFTIPVFFKLR